MWRFLTQGLIFTAIFLFGLAALWMLQQHTQVITLKVAAGHKSSDSYQLMKVITKQLHQRLPRLNFELLETSGSKQNMQLLKQGRVDLVTAQADIVHAESARLIASLYTDYYQLLVRRESGINDFADLEGKQIAVAEKSSGQYSSFLLLAEHYGFDIQRMNLLSLSTQAAHQALLAGQVDAVFRVRTLTHRDTKRLLRNDDILIKAIDQAKNLHIKNPYLEHNILPKGIYQTTPPIPAHDLNTVSVQRLLITHKDTDLYIVHAITRLLFEEQYAFSRKTALARFIQDPRSANKNPILPLHAGSRRYYNRDHPSFLQEQAEPIIVMLLILTLLAVYLIRLQKKQKTKHIQSYHHEVMLLLEKITQHSETDTQLQKRLLSLLKKATIAQTKGQLNIEDFQVFAFNWQLAHSKLEMRLQADKKGAL